MTCNKVIYLIDTVSTKIANTIATNVTKRLQNKKKRFLYLACSFISNHITIDNYYYLLSLCKT